MNSLHTAKLTDGVIFLRPLTAEDAADHLAGEDEEMAKWEAAGGVRRPRWKHSSETARRIGAAAARAGLLAYSIV